MEKNVFNNDKIVPIQTNCPYTTNCWIYINIPNKYIYIYSV